MDTEQRVAFFNELTKIAQEQDNKITKDKVKRLAQYGLAGAAGMGAGYASGELVAKPLQRKLLEMGSPNAAKFLRYAVPTTVGLGAALALARSKATGQLIDKIRGEGQPST